MFWLLLGQYFSGHTCRPSVSKCIDTGALLGVDFHIQISRDDWIHNSNVLEEKKTYKVQLIKSRDRRTEQSSKQLCAHFSIFIITSSKSDFYFKTEIIYT